MQRIRNITHYVLYNFTTYLLTYLLTYLHTLFAGLNDAFLTRELLTSRTLTERLSKLIVDGV